MNYISFLENYQPENTELGFNWQTNQNFKNKGFHAQDSTIQ